RSPLGTNGRRSITPGSSTPASASPDATAGVPASASPASSGVTPASATPASGGSSTSDLASGGFTSVTTFGFGFTRLRFGGATDWGVGGGGSGGGGAGGASTMSMGTSG